MRLLVSLIAAMAMVMAFSATALGASAVNE